MWRQLLHLVPGVLAFPGQEISNRALLVPVCKSVSLRNDPFLPAGYWPDREN